MADRWLDGVETGWSIPLMLIAFAAIWVLILSLAYLDAGLHPDVLEAWSAGRTLDWGNDKHPPLMGWITHAWTSVMPLSDWSMQCLAMVNAAMALWFVDLIARRFVRGDKRAIILLLAMLLPAYHLHAQRFNANAVLLAVWPLAIYCFLRSFETRAIGWAIAAGAASALAMLGKYYSAFLIASFVAAAIVHPRRLDYLRSPAPWVSTIAGFVVLAPHLYWLGSHQFATFTYVFQFRGGMPLADAGFRAAKFVAGIAAWLSLPLLIWLAVLRPRAAEPAPADDGLQLLRLVFIGTILFPVLAAISLGSTMPGIWALQGLFLGIILFVARGTHPDREKTLKLSTMIAVLTLLAVIPALLHAVYRNQHPFKEGRNFYEPAAMELTQRWRARTSSPLAFVSGEDSLAFAAAFYGADHPVHRRPFEMQGENGSPPWMQRQGWAALCFETNVECVGWLRQLAGRNPHAVLDSFTVHSSLFGQPGRSANVRALMAPPPDDGRRKQGEAGDFIARSRFCTRPQASQRTTAKL